MKERQILFSGPMVRAILEGRKTQTRRIVNPQPEERLWKIFRRFSHQRPTPYGNPGDHLWVRETWQPIRSLTVDEQIQQKTIMDRFFNREIPAEHIVDAAKSLPMGSGDLKALYAADFGDWAYATDSDLRPWKPSIFMPRWASRITLEITDVRVQQLQDVSEEDAAAEGVDWIPEAPAATNHRTSFAGLWDSINIKRAPWASNPWVWAISFQRVPSPSDSQGAHADPINAKVPA